MSYFISTSKNRHLLEFSPVAHARFDMLQRYMNNFDCMFLTSYKEKLDHNLNARSDMLLKWDLEHSGNSYITLNVEFARLGQEKLSNKQNLYCVISDEWGLDAPMRFMKYAKELCRTEQLEGALVTIPQCDKSNNDKLTVWGNMIDHCGEVMERRENMSVKEVENYYMYMLGTECMRVTSADIHLK